MNPGQGWKECTWAGGAGQRYPDCGILWAAAVPGWQGIGSARMKAGAACSRKRRGMPPEQAQGGRGRIWTAAWGEMLKAQARERKKASAAGSRKEDINADTSQKRVQAYGNRDGMRRGLPGRGRPGMHCLLRDGKGRLLLLLQKEKAHSGFWLLYFFYFWQPYPCLQAVLRCSRAHP